MYFYNLQQSLFKWINHHRPIWCQAITEYTINTMLMCLITEGWKQIGGIFGFLSPAGERERERDCVYSYPFQLVSEQSVWPPPWGLRWRVWDTPGLLWLWGEEGPMSKESWQTGTGCAIQNWLGVVQQSHGSNQTPLQLSSQSARIKSEVGWMDGRIKD